MHAKFVLSALAVAALVACGNHDVALSEAPPRGATAPLPQLRESTLAAKLVVPFARLAEVANGNAPGAFSKDGRQPACQRIGPKGDLPFGGSFDLTKEVCMDVDYQVSASRGAISIGPGALPNSLRVALPIRFDGWAGFSGDLAKLLKLNRKNFEGAVDAHVDITADVGADWCPKLSGTADFRWTSPAKVEVIGGVWVPIAGLVDGELRSRMETLKTALEDSIDCQAVRAEVAKLWTTRSIAVKVVDGVTAFINIEPTAVGFSGLKTSVNTLELALQAQARLAVDTTAREVAALPLPALQRIPVAPGRIAMAVPLRAAYEPLTLALEAELKGKTYAADTPAGKVAVTVQGIRIYPSQENLVVGVRFKADVPGKVFDVAGEVFLYGRPTVDQAGQVVAVQDLKFARILDNDLWSVLSAVFENQIRSAIADKAVFDLGGMLATAQAALTAKLAEVHAQSGVRIELAGARIALGLIVPADEALVVEGIFESTAQIHLGASALTP